MIGLRLINFLPPESSAQLLLNAPSGRWTLSQDPRFDEARDAIGRGMCAETYILTHPASMADGAAACDAAFEEVTPILLGATYLLGLSVTINRSSPGGVPMIRQPSDHWPRERAVHAATPLVGTDKDLVTAIERVVALWTTVGRGEKALLLFHHWIDALACWSLEDLYLSTTTLLQVISATEADRQSADLSFFKGLTGAASRLGIRAPSHDWVKMRNALVHEGSLSPPTPSGFPRSKEDCADIAADALNWLDEYIVAALNLGLAPPPRFKKWDLFSLKAYSLD